MKIVFLTNNTPKSKCLESLFIENNLPLEKVIIVNRQKMVSRNNKVFLILKFAFRALKKLLLSGSHESELLRLELRCKEICDKKLDEYIKNCFVSISNKKEIDRLEVSDINGDIVAATLRELKPDICIVWGTPILKSSILDLCPLFVNAHTSLLPHYKGTFSEFWQCYNEDRKSIGVTFHVVDSGVDTGAIIQQIPQTINGPLEPYWLRLNNTKLILKHYPDVINSIKSGTLRVQAQSTNEAAYLRTFRAIDRTVEKRLELYSRLKLKHTKLPNLLDMLGADSGEFVDSSSNGTVQNKKD